MIKTTEPLDVCSSGEQLRRTVAGEGRNGMAGADFLTEPGRRGRPRGDAAGRIGKAYAFMVQHLNESLHIAALGRMAGLSPSSFYQLFKMATGWTPNVFVMRMRMHRACELLQATDLRVKEIAAQLGYRDQFYFSRVFKSVAAVAPVEYRRLHPPLQRQIQAKLAPAGRAAEGNTEAPLRRTFSGRGSFFQKPLPTKNLQPKRGAACSAVPPS